MQTPRPDHFTYPHGGSPADRVRPWMRAAFVVGLVGAFVLVAWHDLRERAASDVSSVHS